MARKIFMKTLLVLKDGTVFEGRSFGVEGEKIGRVVFNTGVIGYQELITDPSYRGLFLTMSYPLIGNYGINEAGYESNTAQIEALIVKENSHICSNWSAQESLEDFMKKNGIMGIEGIDTRALVVHTRDKGEMIGVISTKDFNIKSLINKAKRFSYKEKDLVSEVTVSTVTFCKAPESIDYKIVVIDIGGTNSLFNDLRKSGCQLIRVPANTSFQEILKLTPDGIVLSSGPEDIKSLSKVACEVKNLLGKKPLLGISSGNLVLGIALGGKIKQMKCGHHGLNQPVRTIKTGKAEITIQNHSYIIDDSSIQKADIEVTQINMNDQSIEGIRSNRYPAMGVQYIPTNFDIFLNSLR